MLVLFVWLSSLVLKAFWERHRDRMESHFNRIGYVRIYVIAGFLLSLAFAWGFGECIEMAFQKDPASSFDQLFSIALHSEANHSAVEIFGYITLLGDTLTALVLGLLMGLWLLLRKEYSLLTMWCVGLSGNTLLIKFLKSGFQRHRPVFEDPFSTEPYYSFPSGHSMTAIVLYGLLAYVAYKLVPSSVNWMTTTVLLTIGTLVGMSRLVLGVHYFSDVLGGWIVGFEWVAVCVVGTQIYLCRWPR